MSFSEVASLLANAFEGSESVCEIVLDYCVKCTVCDKVNLGDEEDLSITQGHIYCCKECMKRDAFMRSLTSFYCSLPTSPNQENKEKRKEPRNRAFMYECFATYHPAYHHATQRFNLRLGDSNGKGCELPFWLCECKTCSQLWMSCLQCSETKTVNAFFNFLAFIRATNKEQPMTFLRLPQMRGYLNDFWNYWSTLDYGDVYCQEKEMLGIWNLLVNFTQNRGRKKYFEKKPVDLEFQKLANAFDLSPRLEFLMERGLVVQGKDQKAYEILPPYSLSDLKLALAGSWEKYRNECALEFARFKQVCKVLKWV